MTPQHYHANGKILLTGEYFIIDGAEGIALPSPYGQSMEVMPYQKGVIHWRSYDQGKALWLECIIDSTNWEIKHSNNDTAAIRLLQVLKTANNLNPSIDLQSGFNIWTRLDFDRSWGLGSSSTMLSLVAQWTQVDPFQLAAMTFGGSGYDIACATADGPIIYSKKENNPVSRSIGFNPVFKNHILFIHLGKKQDTQEALQLYKSLDGTKKSEIQDQIQVINQRMLAATSIQEFQSAMEDHEDLISKHLHLPKVKDLYFGDFEGSVKSLGAWGGDFVMAAGDSGADGLMEYFKEKGYEVSLTWGEMVR